MNSLVCVACAAAVLLLAGAEAGEAPVQKRGVVGLGYGLHGGVGYAGGYGYGYGHGHGYSLSPVASYAYHGYHAPLAYSKVAYPAYSYSAYPYYGYNKLAYSGYPLGYSKVAYSAYPAIGYSKVLSPYHYW